MRDNALYFPYISVPNDRWTIKTLLYWDKLSSIVPMSYIEEPEQLTPFMQSLVKENLVEQVFPAHHLYKIDKFESCFISLINHRLKLREKLKSSQAIKTHSNKEKRTTIHAEKLGDIPDFLVEKGLAEELNWAWFKVDKWVADLFMAYLASCLGALNEINAAPVTNQVSFTRMFGKLTPTLRRNKATHHDKARGVILNSLIPVPKEQVTLDQLLKFKSDHGDLLPALRRTIESRCSVIATMSNAEDRALETERFVNECKERVAEITDAMKPTWHKLSFGTIAPLFGSGCALLASNLSNSIAFAGSALSFSACAYEAISSIHRNRKVTSLRPLAYVAHARSKLI